jgi:hypothetical protein
MFEKSRSEHSIGIGRKIYGWKLMRLAWLLLVSLPSIYGQDLRVSSVTGGPGEQVAVEVSFNSAAGNQPTALQWETIFPAELLDLEGIGPETGPAGKDSGKSVTCAALRTYSLICVLAGGKNPITNGSIAVFHFRIRANARVGTSVLKIQRAEAVTEDLKGMVLKDAEGTLSIH